MKTSSLIVLKRTAWCNTIDSMLCAMVKTNMRPQHILSNMKLEVLSDNESQRRATSFILLE